MDIIDAVLNLSSSISNYFSILIQRIVSIGDSIIEVFNYIGSIFSSIRFGLTSLLSGIRDIITDVLSQGFFSSLYVAFDNISDYIGGPATTIIASLLLIAMIRIGIAFVFKILRLNIDYHTLQNKDRTIKQHEALHHK